MTDAEKVTLLTNTLEAIRMDLRCIDSPNESDSYIDSCFDVIWKALEKVKND